MSDKKLIYVDEDHPEMPIAEALKLMTDEWLDSGNYCTKTVMDLRDWIKADTVRKVNDIALTICRGMANNFDKLAQCQAVIREIVDRTDSIEARFKGLKRCMIYGSILENVLPKLKELIK